jgi:hypothetical protein
MFCRNHSVRDSIVATPPASDEAKGSIDPNEIHSSAKVTALVERAISPPG